MKNRVLTLVVGLLLAASAGAQDNGRIKGQVTRGDGSAIAAVAVVINELGSAQISDQQGAFRFANVPPGTYTVSFTFGENVSQEAGVEVKAGETTTLSKTVDWELTFLDTITVYSASRRAERIVDAPAAVTLVTAEQIEREAAHGQLPKLLEFTPGAEVTQSGIYDYNLNTRGFNSSLNRRVATLIDGRNTAVPFLGAQEWAAVSFPLDDLQSLELVRGPSAALYGANASSGVLNMITKAPRNSQGGQLRLTAGDLSTTNVDARWAGALGGDWYLKLVGGLRDHEDFTKSRRGAAEYSVPCGGGVSTDCLPQEAVPLGPIEDNIEFGSVRVDKYIDEGRFFTLEAGQANIEGPTFQTGIGRVQLVDIERPFARFNFSANRWNLQLSYNKRDASKQTALASGANIVLDTENINLEVQGNWDFNGGKSRLVLGGSYKDEDIDSFDPTQGRQTLVFEPITNAQQAIFGQYDVELSDNFKLVLAGRWDNADLHDSQFSPKGSIVWGVGPNSTLRFTYNEAFQVANYSEFFLQAPVAPSADLSGVNFLVCVLNGLDCGLGVTPVLAVGNKDLELEEVKTFEIGYSGIIAEKAFITLDYYNSDNTNFITDLIPQLETSLGRVNPNFGPWQAPAGVPESLAAVIRSLVPILTNNLDGSNILAAVSYTNFGAVDTQGIDFGLNYYLNNQWTWNASYSWFDFELKDAAEFETILLPNTPENKFSTGISLVKSNWDANLSLRWVDDFRWAVGPFQGDVESYTTADLGANYQINDHWSVGLNVSNLLDDQHFESFGGDIIERRALGNVAFSW